MSAAARPPEGGAAFLGEDVAQRREGSPVTRAKARHGRQQALFGWINFALTAPSIYLWLGLPLIMRQQGWSGTEIGLFQLAGLPAAFKMLLALPVERWPSSRPAYKTWAWLTGGGYLLALLALATVGADCGKGMLFALVLAAALFATWADIPVNALAIELLPPAERPRAGGIRSAATFAGAVVGGGAMLLLQQALGWAAPFLAMSACLLPALVLIAAVPEGERPAPAPPPFRLWAGFFRQPGGGTWAVLLLGYYPFVAAAWIYLKPLLLDHGFAPARVAWIAGVGGGALGALASLATGFVRRERLARALPASAFANAGALAFLGAVVWQGAPAAWLIAASAFLALAMGVASSLVFALMMEFARSECRAADYGLQASLFTLGRIAILPVAGQLLDRSGYPAMLATLALAALSVALLIGARCAFRPVS